MKPLIGITCPVSDGVYKLRTEYADAVYRAGGLPVILAYTDEPAAIAEAVDGILFTGGGDIHPKFLGEEAHPEISGVDESRDMFELALCKEAYAQSKPILCICRGMQLLNVCLRGTLFQHIENHRNERGKKILHPVEIRKETALYSIFGESVQVNSRHHQAISKPGPLISVSACAPDGTIEAIEIPGYCFAIGVQWHPEDLIIDYPEQLKLLEAFVRAAKKHD